MKNCVTSPSSLENTANLSFFGVWDLIAVEGLFMFSVPKLDLSLFYLIERSASVTYKMSQANWIVLNEFLIKKKRSLLKLLYFLLFWRNVWFLSKTASIKFYVCFSTEEMLPVYIPTRLEVSLLHEITNHLSNALE